jgi:hypothetical protein
MKKLIALIALSMGLAHAGEMRTIVDKFQGEARTSFMSRHSGMVVMISKWSDKDASIMAGITAPGTITHCNAIPMLMKTKDGQIHRLETTEIRSKGCQATVPYELIRDGFYLRVPLFNRPAADAEVNTDSMDWAAMGTRKIEQ